MQKLSGRHQAFREALLTSLVNSVSPPSGLECVSRVLIQKCFILILKSDVDLEAFPLTNTMQTIHCSLLKMKDVFCIF